VTSQSKIIIAAAAFIVLLLVSAFAVVGYYLIGFNVGQRHLARAHASTSHQQYDAAIADYTRALQYPLGTTARSYALANRGVCEARRQKPRVDEALNDLTAAVGLNERLADAFTERGSLRLPQGDDNGAWEDFSRAIAIDPNAAFAFLRRGTIAARRQQWDAAISDFSEAIRANPNEPSAYVYRGDAYARRQDFDRALASFESAIRIAPNYAPAYLYRGFLHHDRRDLYKANADYSAALRIKPDFPEAYWARIRVSLEKRNFRDAIADYSELLRLDPRDSVALQGRGLAYGRADDLSNAVADFTELIRLTQSRQAYELRAMIFTLQARYREALADYRIAVQQSGEIGFAKSLPWLLATCPDATIRNGEEAVARAREDCVQTQWENGNCIDTLAAAYAETGDFAEAIKYQEQALANDRINLEMRSDFEIRLSLYQTGIAFRDTAKKMVPRPPPTPIRKRPQRAPIGTPQAGVASAPEIDAIRAATPLSVGQ
jgi:tetratricopeptide (TPR) repeat protein